MLGETFHGKIFQKSGKNELVSKFVDIFDKTVAKIPINIRTVNLIGYTRYIKMKKNDFCMNVTGKNPIRTGKEQTTVRQFPALKTRYSI